MLKRLLLFVAIFALVSAAQPPAGAHYKVDFYQSAVVKGQVLAAGEYKLTLGDSKVTFTDMKGSVDVPARIVTQEEKFNKNALRYSEVNGKQIITEIWLGGTTTKVLFF